MVKYLVLSDIHFGHKRNLTNSIVNHLELFFKDYGKKLINVDIIFLAGDVYDKILYHSSEEAILALRWLMALVKYCSKNSIKLRILEGTPSHDWKQCSVLDKIINDLNINVDFKYIDTVHIECMDDLNLNVLYVPDEWRATISETMSDIHDALKEKHLLKVDIAIMHGQFKHHLPFYKDEHVFDESEVMALVNKYISIGHIHTPQVYERILTQGSFDRLAHGEEEKKGGMLITLDVESSFEVLVNKRSTVFKSVKIRNDTDTELTRVDNIASKLPDNSNLRLVLPNNMGVLSRVDDLRKRYPNLRISKKINKKDTAAKTSIVKDVTIHNVSITKDNLKQIVTDRLIKKDTNINVGDIVNVLARAM